jgi:hypothetical protein
MHANRSARLRVNPDRIPVGVSGRAFGQINIRPTHDAKLNRRDDLSVSCPYVIAGSSHSNAPARSGKNQSEQ